MPPEQFQGLQILKEELAERHAAGEYPRVEILGLRGPWQNASMVFGLEDIIGYNPLRLADYERAVGPGENAEDPNLRQFPATFRGYKCRLASLLGLEYLVLDRPIEKLPRHFPRLSGSEAALRLRADVDLSPQQRKPRVYVARKVMPVNSEAALDQEELPEFDRATEALIDDASMGQLKGTYATLPAAAAVSTPTSPAYERNTVTIEVDTDSPGVLVLHDIYYPGWEATVDGVRRPILRANLLFRGVEISKGHHVVQFDFRPTSIENLIAAATDLVDGDDEPVRTVATAAIQ